jgi:hypothetical protein
VVNKERKGKHKRCHGCRKGGYFIAECRKKNISLKTTQFCDVDQILECGFVAKASSLKPRPSLLYLEAQISNRDTSFFVDTGATYSMSPNLAKELGLQVQKASKSMNVLFLKDKPYNTKDVALDVTLECEKLDFR